MRRSGGLTFIILLGAIIVFALLLRPGQQGVGSAPATVPSAVSSEQTELVEPALLVQPAEAAVVTPTAVPQEITPTIPPPPIVAEGTPTPLSFSAESLQLPQGGGDSTASEGVFVDWNPPALEVPLARHPNDHYWMIRPVAANFRNTGLPHYPFGSDGPADDWRVHHGIDISNPIGVEVMAAADGEVVWADKGHTNLEVGEAITSYGNTVVILHDFGFEGQPIWTLYAHLAAILVEEGQRVEAGDVIGLIGNTGLVSGPHVHFEVRIGRNSYYDVYNPDLWIAPFVASGVVAGHIEIEKDAPAYDADVQLVNQETGNVSYSTTSYSGWGLQQDSRWQENFVIANVAVGSYFVLVTHGDNHWTGEVVVIEGLTNWVELTWTEPPPPSE